LSYFCDELRLLRGWRSKMGFECQKRNWKFGRKCFVVTLLANCWWRNWRKNLEILERELFIIWWLFMVKELKLN
jgi:hypothetical protein